MKIALMEAVIYSTVYRIFLTYLLHFASDFGNIGYRRCPRKCDYEFYDNLHSENHILLKDVIEYDSVLSTFIA
jgi:hypothetical protein